MKKVICGLYQRMLITVRFSEGTLPENTATLLAKGNVNGEVVRFADGGGYIILAELIGKEAGDAAINSELDFIGARVDGALRLGDGTAKAHAVVSLGTDSERWDDLLSPQEKKLVQRDKWANLIKAYADSVGFACPVCGSKLFESAQSCRHDIIVDGDNDFVEDVGVSYSEKPDGSAITCLRCGAEIGDEIPANAAVIPTDGKYLNVGTIEEPKLVSYLWYAKAEKWPHGKDFKETFQKLATFSDDAKALAWADAQHAGATIENLECGFFA